MDITTLVADPTAINISHFVSEPQSVTVVVQAVRPQATCPKCQHPSTSLHSHYQRTVADLPWHGVRVRVSGAPNHCCAYSRVSQLPVRLPS